MSPYTLSGGFYFIGTVTFDAPGIGNNCLLYYTMSSGAVITFFVPGEIIIIE